MNGECGSRVRRITAVASSSFCSSQQQQQQPGAMAAVCAPTVSRFNYERGGSGGGGGAAPGPPGRAPSGDIATTTRQRRWATIERTTFASPEITIVDFCPPLPHLNRKLES